MSSFYIEVNFELIVSRNRRKTTKFNASKTWDKERERAAISSTPSEGYRKNKILFSLHTVSGFVYMNQMIGICI